MVLHKTKGEKQEPETVHKRCPRKRKLRDPEKDGKKNFLASRLNFPPDFM